MSSAQEHQNQYHVADPNLVAKLAESERMRLDAVNTLKQVTKAAAKVTEQRDALMISSRASANMLVDLRNQLVRQRENARGAQRGFARLRKKIDFWRRRYEELAAAAPRHVADLNTRRATNAKALGLYKEPKSGNERRTVGVR